MISNKPDSLLDMELSFGGNPVHFLLLRKRRGAINTKQLQFLEKYRPKSRLKFKNGHKGCSIQ